MTYRKVNGSDVSALIRAENALADVLRALRDTGNDDSRSDPIAVAALMIYDMRVRAERLERVDAETWALS